MKPRLLTREQLDGLLDRLAGETALHAPVRTGAGTEFRRVRSHHEIDTSRVNTKLPAKSALFPQCEVMLRYDESGATAEPEPPAEQVWFGIRPCDAAALAFLDRFFCASGPTDPYVKARRERTVLIGLACLSPAATCFCLAVGGSPAGTKGLDLLLTELDGRLLAEPLTARGETLVRDLPEAAAADIAHKTTLTDKAAAAIKTRIDVTGLKKRLDANFDHPAWETLSRACVNCGACTFLCPTCHCFDVADEQRHGRGARLRVWDSCQFCLYSQHASGHNPRLAPRSRYRNRVLDKFKYTQDQVGEISCVGCGRCIISCPSAIDIRETVASLLKELPEK